MEKPKDNNDLKPIATALKMLAWKLEFVNMGGHTMMTHEYPDQTTKVCKNKELLTRVLHFLSHLTKVEIIQKF